MFLQRAAVFVSEGQRQQLEGRVLTLLAGVNPKQIGEWENRFTAMAYEPRGGGGGGGVDRDFGGGGAADGMHMRARGRSEFSYLTYLLPLFPQHGDIERMPQSWHTIPTCHIVTGCASSHLIRCSIFASGTLDYS